MNEIQDIVGSPLIEELRKSICDEELALDRLLTSVKSGKPAAIMKAARELAAIREPHQADNCVD